MSLQGRPPLLNGNMIFFSHSINLIKEDYQRFHHHMLMKPNYVVTLAYTFPRNDLCLVASSVKQPQDKYVRKVGNHLAFCRLAQAVESLEKGEDLPKHCVTLVSEEVLADRLAHDFYFSTIPERLFGKNEIEERAKEFHSFISGRPVKEFRHDHTQSAALAKLKLTDRPVQKAFVY